MSETGKLGSFFNFQRQLSISTFLKIAVVFAVSFKLRELVRSYAMDKSGLTIPMLLHRWILAIRQDVGLGHPRLRGLQSSTDPGHGARALAKVNQPHRQKPKP